MIYQVLYHCFIFKIWYIMIRKGSQIQSTRVHSDFKHCNCDVTLLFRDIQYQIVQVVGYHPILLNWCQVTHFISSGNGDTGLLLAPLNKIGMPLLNTWVKYNIEESTRILYPLNYGEDMFNTSLWIRGNI